MALKFLSIGEMMKSSKKKLFVLTAVAGIMVLMATFPRQVSAFPIQLGAEGTWISKDKSSTSLVGPYHEELRLFKKGKLVKEHIIDIPAGGSKTYKDFKTKSGGLKLKTIDGDPLAFFDGPILGGAGTLEIEASGIPFLFPSVEVNISLVSGSWEAAVTLPGDQLTGPDGGDTFIHFTSTWESFDPIGTFLDTDGTVYDIALGRFDLVSSGRPSEFFYSLNPDGTGHMNFTVGENLVFGTGTPDALGTVTKDLDFQITPEPSTLPLLGTGLVGLLGYSWRRKKQEEKDKGV